MQCKAFFIKDVKILQRFYFARNKI